MQNNWPRAGFEPTSPASEFRFLGAKRSTHRWKNLKSLARAILEPTTSNKTYHTLKMKRTRRPRTSGIFSTPNHLSNKIVLSPKIFTNTYRMELNSCQLNSVNVLLHIMWTINLGKFCKKKPFHLNIFLSHMKYGRKTINC